MSSYFGEIYLRFWKEKLDKVADREVSDIVGIYQTYKGKKPKRVFDIGAGWGRHMIKLYSRGIETWGIEKEPIFVKAFTEEAPPQLKGHLIQGDITQWKVPEELKGTFDMAISLFSSIGWSDDSMLFKKVYLLLSKGGLFIVDTDNRDGYVIHPPSRTWQRVEGGVVLDKHKINWTTSKLITTREIHSDTGEIFTLKREMRLYSLHELINMASETGFSFLGAFSDLHMRGWTPRSGRNVVIFEK